MRFTILFMLLFFVLLCRISSSQTIESHSSPIWIIVDDAGSEDAANREYVITVGEHSNHAALDNLLGLSKDHAHAVIDHYDHHSLPILRNYPYIKEVIEVGHLRRWGFPTTLYIFVDSSDE